MEAYIKFRDFLFDSLFKYLHLRSNNMKLIDD